MFLLDHSAIRLLVVPSSFTSSARHEKNTKATFFAAPYSSRNMLVTVKSEAREARNSRKLASAKSRATQHHHIVASQHKRSSTEPIYSPIVVPQEIEALVLAHCIRLESLIERIK